MNRTRIAAFAVAAPFALMLALGTGTANAQTITENCPNEPVPAVDADCKVRLTIPPGDSLIFKF